MLWRSGAGDLFVDGNGSVFEDDINKLGTAGVTKGCNPPTNDRFCPNGLVKRDEMASFLTRALGLTPVTPPTSSTTSTSTSTTSTTLAPGTVEFGPGTHRIGIDIPAGIYRNEGDRSGCYWERLSGFSGESEDRITNDYISGMESVLVQVEPTDVGFYADEDCGTWAYQGP